MTKTPNFKQLDVRKLFSHGIEPFPAIRRCFESLEPGEGLAIIAQFLPGPLIEKFRRENFSSRVEHQPDGSWVTYLWQQNDAP